MQYATSDGTAHAPGEYTSVSGSFTFNPGDRIKTFSVPIIDNAIVDGTRTINLNLSSLTNATLGGLSTAVIRIIDNEAPANAIVVNSTDDDSFCDTARCTLRGAINLANVTPGTDFIAFNIAGAGVHTIAPASVLPTIKDPVIIDGTTQPGFAGSPIIEIDVTNARGNGLAIRSWSFCRGR